MVEMRESLAALRFVDSLIVDPHLPSRDADEGRLLLFHPDSLPMKCGPSDEGIEEEEVDDEEELEREDVEEEVSSQRKIVSSTRNSSMDGLSPWMDYIAGEDHYQRSIIWISLDFNVAWMFLWLRCVLQNFCPCQESILVTG